MNFIIRKMKKYFFGGSVIVLCFLWSVFPVPAQPDRAGQISAEKKTVGVATFEARSLGQDEANLAAELFQAHLVDQHIYQVLDRRNLEKTLKEVELQQSGLTQSEGAVKAGKMLNASFIIYGTLSKTDNSYFLTVTMVDIEKNEIEKSVSQKFTRLDNLDVVVKNLVLGLVRGDRVESYVDNIPKDPEGIRNYLVKKYIRSDKYRQREVVDFVYNYDEIAENYYAFLVFKEVEMPSGEVTLKIYSNLAIGVVFKPERLSQKAREAFEEKKNVVVYTEVFKPKNKNNLELKYSLYQKNGNPDTIELYLVTRNKDWSAKKPVIKKYPLKKILEN